MNVHIDAADAVWYKIALDEPFNANDAVPNKEPVNDVAVTEPVTLTEPVIVVEPETLNEPVISANPAFCIIKLLPLVKTKDELFVVSDVAIVVNDVTVNEPVIIWFPLNEFEPVVAYEPVFELNCCIELLTLAV